jgi:hypothetical protein
MATGPTGPLVTAAVAVQKTAKWAFIPDWKFAHKFWSIQISIVGAILSGAWVALPAFQYIVPPREFVLLSIAVSVAVVVARMIDQPNLPTVGDPNA